MKIDLRGGMKLWWKQNFG